MIENSFSAIFRRQSEFLRDVSFFCRELRPVGATVITARDGPLAARAMSSQKRMAGVAAEAPRKIRQARSRIERDCVAPGQCDKCDPGSPSPKARHATIV